MNKKLATSVERRELVNNKQAKWDIQEESGESRWGLNKLVSIIFGNENFFLELLSESLFE